MSCRSNHPFSLCSQKVRLTLAEKEIPYDSRIIDIGPAHENYEPWYMRLNSRGVVPTLVHNGKVITNSATIIRYLDSQFPEHRLTPQDPKHRKAINKWIQIQDRFPMRELTYGRWRGLSGFLSRAGLKKRQQILLAYQAQYPELTEEYAAKLADLRQWRSQVMDQASIRKLELQMSTLLDQIEEELQRGKWLCGETYTLADLVWTVILARLELLRLHCKWRKGRRPALEDYVERVKFRPSFNEAMIYTRITPKIALPHLIHSLQLRRERRRRQRRERTEPVYQTSR